MRIGYLYNFEAYPPRGGNHIHAMELTQGFIREGHTVSVMDDPTMPGVTSYSSHRDGVKQFLESVEVIYVRIDARFLTDWPLLDRCMQLKGQCPVVWEINAPANETLAYSWLSGKIGRQESLVRRLRRSGHAMRKLPGILQEERYRRKMARNVSAAICVSKSLAVYAADGLGIESPLVLPNGGPRLSLDEIAHRRGRRKWRGFTVLYCGSAIYPWQGLNFLNEVIALAHRVAPDMTFILAVNQRRSDLPNSKNVIILERQSREEVFDLICSVDACVSLHPEYPWSKYNFHNSPMKLFEYLACMKPVVASNHGQMKDIIRDGVDGLLCANEPEEILKKLTTLKNNRKIADRIGKAGWARVQSEFSWENNVHSTLNVLEECRLRT